MRRLILATPLLCSLLTATAFADTIIGLVPNDGSGDNFGFRTYGPGYNISGGGGIPADAFSDFPPGYAPGSTFGIGGAEIFFEDGFAKLGPISSDVDFTDGTLFVSSVTLPTNGKDFRAFVTVSFNASGIFLATGEPISANGSAHGYIDFSYIDGAYYPGAFKETPEPGTLALVGTGVLGIVARAKKRLMHQPQRHRQRGC
jgi:hypothetical protein